MYIYNVSRKIKPFYKFHIENKKQKLAIIISFADVTTKGKQCKFDKISRDNTSMYTFLIGIIEVKLYSFSFNF